jgi:hypothetical protein
MKKLFLALLISGSVLSVQAQEKSTGDKIEHGAKKTGHAVKKGGKAVGHKTAEVASKGSSKVVHTKYKDKVGPNGETIYIDKHSKYYWIDKKGKRHNIAASALRNPHL